ncbi:MAG: zinc ribbon domain-containing protein [Candidatus Roizmanbacteria bacterium]|nr:zinc ribbon domain-containing protein [Candidatus Roizmanbacteria bacterium]
MITFCSTCGMPLEKKEDVGLVNTSGSFCRYCVKKDGKVKTADQIFAGGVSFFMHSIEGTPLALAERITRRNMKSLPFWKARKDQCLVGDEATDEEYADAMKKVGE